MILERKAKARSEDLEYQAKQPLLFLRAINREW